MLAQKNALMLKLSRTDLEIWLSQQLFSFTKLKPTFNPSTVLPPHPIVQTKASETVEQVIPSLPSPSCPKLLLKLEKITQMLPDMIPMGLELGLFTIYLGDPAAMVGDDMSEDDIWEQLVSKKLHAVFWAKSVEDVTALVHRGPLGINGFIHFATYFTQVHGLSKVYFHEQTETLTKAIQKM